MEAVLLALKAAERVFGVDMNSRGYKVPKGCGVIQGDGISIEMLDNILQAVMAKGYSAQVRLLSKMPWQLSLPVDSDKLTSLPINVLLRCVCASNCHLTSYNCSMLERKLFLTPHSLYRCHAVRPWSGVYACATVLMLHLLCLGHDLGQRMLWLFNVPATQYAYMQAVAFGMGGGLLQRVNRDTMSFATKLSHIVYADGTEADTMKLPKSDSLKYSLPGIMAVKSVKGIPTAFPADGGHVSPEENMLQVVWDNGPVEVSRHPGLSGSA